MVHSRAVPRCPHALSRALLRSLVLVCLLGGCAAPPPVPVRATWVASVAPPTFDPHGPSDLVRESLERALGRGLTDLDSNDTVVPALARRWWWSADRCTLRFQLHPGLRFSDDSLLLASHVREAILAGLARTDHRRSAHLLAAVRGVVVRRARVPEPIGVIAVDATTLEFTLTRPDSMLPAKLALPGVSTPWRVTAGGWGEVVGCGPYRVIRVDGADRLTLVRRPFPGRARATVDTLEVRFVASAARVRSLLRDGATDVVWPLPSPLMATDPPKGYSAVRWPATPERRLVLVLREDRPPLTRADHRLAMLRAVEPRTLLPALGHSSAAVSEWLPGGGGAAPLRPAPVRSEGATAAQDSRRSFHVRLGYEADGAGSRVAAILEERFAAAGLYVRLQPLRGASGAAMMRAPDGPEALLVTVQPLFPGLADALASFADSPSGVGLHGFRTGWRPNDLLGVLSGADSLEPTQAMTRLEAERVALPIARLDWLRFERSGAAGARSDPRFGLEYTELRRVGVDDIGH